MRNQLTLGLFLSTALVAAGCGSSSSDTPKTDSGTPSDSADTGNPGDSGDSGDTGGGKPKEEARAKCTFAAGAKVGDTFDDAALLAKAKAKTGRIVVMMKENRAFDHMLGKHPKVEGIPAAFSNLDATGAKVDPFHETDTCVKPDPEHQWTNMHDMVNGGKMDGFVKNAAAHSTVGDKPFTTDGHYVMGYFDKTELPFYYWLADNYPVADHYFASARSGTWANRLYLMLGSSYGVKDTGKDYIKAGYKNIFDLLTTAGVTWGVYTDEIPFEFALFTDGWTGDHAGVHKIAQFIDEAKTGKLPQVVFIDSKENDEDEHPPADVQKGEAWTFMIYDALTKSPQWLEKDGKGMAIFYTYDEGGGFFDHMPPPEKACVASPDQAEFNNLGVRVPMMLISPYSRAKYVSKLQHEHTSITRFIELMYDLPALTARDANSDALLDMFDFDATPVASPPAPTAAGTGGCKTP